MTDYLDGIGEAQPQGLIWEGDVPPVPDAELLPTDLGSQTSS